MYRIFVIEGGSRKLAREAEGEELTRTLLASANHGARVQGLDRYYICEPELPPEPISEVAAAAAQPIISTGVVERQAYDALKAECDRYRARVEVLESALTTIAAPIAGKPVGNPWGFYDDLRKVAADTVGIPFEQHAAASYQSN